MRPAHPNMYGQPTYVLPPNPVQYYATGTSPVPQYGRNPQAELQQPQQMQPVYLVPQQPVMPQYIGVPTQVVGNPVPQAMAIQGVPAYGAAQPGWAYRPAMAEPAPVWAYGAQQQQQEPRNWQPAYQGGFQGRVEGLGNGVGNFQGRADGHGNGVPGSFQGRADGHGNGVPGNFQGRADGHGNGVPGSFQGRAGNVQSFGKASSEVNRGFENNRHFSSGGAPGRNQHMNRQALPPQSPAPLQSKQLSCEPCEKAFAVYAQYTAHMNTHVQCDDVGCSFSASGKVVKEHKLTAHSKSSNPSPMKAALKKSDESNDEIKAWREERRRNYPTRLNVQRKKEILEGKVARGELLEEDARKRRQRMKEILAKQAELGVPVAEVPSYYLSHKDDRARGGKNSDRKQTPGSTVDGSSASTTNGSDLKKRKLGEDANITTEEQPSKSARMNTDPVSELPTQSKCEGPEAKVDSVPHRDEAGTSQPVEKGARTQCYFYQRGRCRKGNKCHFAHTRGNKKGEEGGRQKGQAPLEKKRPPTLLSKLLQAEITRDKSHILQCLRFFVNNNFLLNGIVQLSSESNQVESEAAEDLCSDYSEGEVVEAPDMLLADTAIINTLLSERPEVLAKVIEMETQA